jgi:ATP-binding cassette subfamily F protein 2
MPSKEERKTAREARKQNKREATVEDAIEALEKNKINARTATGEWAATPKSKDIHITSFSVSYYGRPLVQETDLELNYGRRYGLIGSNGSGKSTILGAIADKEIPIPDHIDTFLLREEAEASDRTALQAVVDRSMEEIKRLEAEEVRIMEEEGPDSEELQIIYERLEGLDPAQLEVRAAELLHGLGFNKVQIQKCTKDLSGGWRMRVALARVLMVTPMLLLLDEPTNHLDIEACVWLEEYLANYPHTLVIVSHSQDFLNSVCTNIIHLKQQSFVYYGGNYNAFIKTKADVEIDQMKRYNKQQEEIAHIKSFIASCGTYANKVSQGKSRQKVLDKMEAAGLIEKVVEDKKIQFGFPDCGELPLPILHIDDVSFSYNGKATDYLYKDLDLSVDLDSRIALVGPNGAGKSTLLKLMCGDISASVGIVKRNPHLRIGRYQQHSVDQLDMLATPLAFMRSQFNHMNLEEEQWRSVIGRWGITGYAQSTQIGKLSDGQKSRIVFCCISLNSPHILLLDEPTNHLDMECIDSLAEGINQFNGGLVLVSHDFRLISQVAKEVWLCDNKNVKKYPGDITAYKKQVADQLHNRLK